jgi:hypothetical protein
LGSAAADFSTNSLLTHVLESHTPGTVQHSSLEHVVVLQKGARFVRRTCPVLQSLAEQTPKFAQHSVELHVDFAQELGNEYNSVFPELTGQWLVEHVPTQHSASEHFVAAQ